ncbi:MAG TPA: FMN-binding protein [Bacillota bacterium]|nr:FMN-binding protein [Bacillota bacterium]HOH10398.1 FMN-binding protein [Bacillota bacterium]HOY89735.1 FMN-binding protein [Bacillota bacterium]HPI01826.1 FMN-binding protein [Bacillota bacterium]HPM63112.1 FMN-binding protein [Bacillota bacterium]
MNGNKVGKGKVGVWTVVLIVVIGVVAIILVGGFVFMWPGLREVKDLVINDVDFQNLHDGTYVGEYIGIKDHLRDTKIEVVVSGGEISSIKVLKGAIDKEGVPRKLTGGLGVDDLLNVVAVKKTLQVDVITGATLTSKTHLKALENALKQAQVD